MTTAPVIDAIPLVQTAVENALRPLVLAQQGGTGAIRMYYQRAPDNATLPCVVHQSQDAGGFHDDRLDNAGWSGLWTIKAFATSIGMANTWLAAVVVGMDSLAAPSGYTIQVEHYRPLTLPPEANIWQAAQLYRIRLYRT